MARPTKCVIDLNAFRENLNAVKNEVGHTKIMALVKADAYGHGLEQMAAEAQDWGIDYLGTATVEEGVQLRKSGINVPILCLGALPLGSEELCVMHQIDQAVFSEEALFRLQKVCEACHSFINVHLKIETGMHRTGVRSGRALQAVLDALRHCSNIRLKGVFTHFGCIGYAG